MFSIIIQFLSCSFPAPPLDSLAPRMCPQDSESCSFSTLKFEIVLLADFDNFYLRQVLKSLLDSFLTFNIFSVDSLEIGFKQ